jgi:RecA-family ATPase
VIAHWASSSFANRPSDLPLTKQATKPPDFGVIVPHSSRPLWTVDSTGGETTSAMHLSPPAISALTADHQRLLSADEFEAEVTPLLVNSKPPLPVSPVSLKGLKVPDRQWIVPEWIPGGVVTGLYGDGGLGKSLVAQQLQTAMALGSAWLALPVETGATLGVYCEDSHDELWRRQADINAEYGIDFDSLAGVHWLPRVGEDNLLIKFSRSGVGELTQFHSHVLAAALDIKARLVVVDTAADVFGGNENDRSQVRQFVSWALGSIAQRINGAVLLCAHPSRVGLASGEGDGGSTGWNNAFRSRLYLRTPVLEDVEKPDPNARVLERRKANYASRNDEIRLRWRNGVIGPEPSECAPGATAFGKLEAADLFLNLVRRFEDQGRPLSVNPKSGNYGPRIFAKLPAGRRCEYREADFRRAMEKLFEDRKIENAPYGRKGDERRKIVIVGSAEIADFENVQCPDF